MSVTRTSAITTVVLTVAFATTANASVIRTSTNEAAFTATLPSPTVQSFDGPQFVITPATPTTAYGLAFSASASNANANGSLSVGGGDIVYDLGGQNYDSFTIGLASPINAFGGNFGPLSSGESITLTTAAGAVTVSDFLPFTNGFLGFTTDAPFSSVTVTSTTGGSIFHSISSVVYGTAPVPEPASLGVLGLGGLCLLRRRP